MPRAECRSTWNANRPIYDNGLLQIDMDRKIPEAMKLRKIEIGSGNPSSKPMKSLNAAWEKADMGRFSLMLESPLWPIAGSTLSRSDYPGSWEPSVLPMRLNR